MQNSAKDFYTRTTIDKYYFKFLLLKTSGEVFLKRVIFLVDVLKISENNRDWKKMIKICS